MLLNASGNSGPAQCTTNIVGWAAAVAFPGKPNTSESIQTKQYTIILPILITCVLCAVAVVNRIYESMDCITSVPLDRWDVEQIDASDDILQVGIGMLLVAHWTLPSIIA